MMAALHPIHEITTSQASGGRTPATVTTESVVREQVLDSHLRNLGHGELSLRSVRAADDISQGHSSAPWSRDRRALEAVGVVIQVGFHRCESRRGVVLQRQVSKAGKLITRERSQAR